MASPGSDSWERQNNVKNTITAGSEVLVLPAARRDSNTEIIVNEDYCVVGKIVSYNASTGAATFTKVWDEDASKTFNGVVYHSGKLTHPDTLTTGQYLPFFRVGAFNSTGTTSFELNTESSSNFSWVGLVGYKTVNVPMSDYYILLDDSVTSQYVITYWYANFYSATSDTQPYSFNKVQTYRWDDAIEPGHCIRSRSGYSTWKAKLYTSYNESTKSYSGLYYSQDAYFVTSLWNTDVVIPRVGSGMANKLDLVPSGYHPFDYVESEDKQACYLKLEETNTSDYSSTATSNSSIYLYDNSKELRNILIPGEMVTINTTPVQVREIETVYSDHVSFTEALTTSITTGTTFTVDFVSRSTWIYLSTAPTRFFWPGNMGYFWPLMLPNTATSGDWYYRYANYGYQGVCEESEELVCAAGAENINGTLYGGPIPDTNWEFPGIGNLASSYTKAISYDYTYKALYGGGGVKISRLASDWKIWDRFATPPAWRNAVAGNTVQSVYIWEIWEGKQRQSLAYFSLTLI